MTDEPEITDKQRAFCLEYVKDFNATQAAIRAGYSVKTAKQQGSRLLTIVDVGAWLSWHASQAITSSVMNAQEVLERLTNLGRFNLKRAVTVTSDGDPYVDLSNLGDEDFEAIGEVEIHDYTDGRGEDKREVRKVKVKAPHKLGALTLLAKHHNLITDKLEVTVVGDFQERMDRANARAKGGR